MDSGSVSLQDLIRRRQAAGFVGRDGQLAQFAANFELAAQDQRRRFVFCIHGDGGVGKTFLLGQLRRIATERRAVSAYVDEAVFSVPEAMARIAEQMAEQGHPMKGLLRMVETYRKRRSEVEADPQAPTGITTLMTRTATKLGVEALRTVPVAGAVAAVVDGEALADQTDHLRKFLGEKLRHEDVRMLLSPAEALTPTFVRELAAGKQARPLALFFDTYERTGPFLDDWLRALLEGQYGPLPTDVVITIAGRDPLDAAAWSPYLGVVADVPLVPFSDVEARQMLNGRGIVDERVIDVIVQLSGGLPLLVAMLAEHKPDDAAAVGDPSGDAVERFLKWETDPVRRALAVTAALPRSVNEDVLHELVEEGADSRELFGWLRSLSFVTHHAGRCQYHEVVRSAMLRLERGQSPTRWKEQHRRLAEFYRALRTARSEKDAWKDETWRGFRLEESYHALCGGSSGAVAEVLSGVIYALAEGASIARAWVQAIGQAGEDSGDVVVKQWGTRLAQAQAEPERVAGAIVDLLLRHGGLETRTTAEAHCIRGRERRGQGQYDEALADFTRALELNPDDARAIADRCEIYRVTARFEEALADFARSLELEPDYVWAVGSRGQTYREMGRYEEALIDLNRALELDPDCIWVVADRGEVHRLKGRFEEALVDFTRALDLDSDYVWPTAHRGQTYREMGRFEEALVDFTRALELEPGYAWATAGRGRTYYEMGWFEEALVDLNRALELDPDRGWVVADRGEVFRLLGRYEEALVDFARALELDPDYFWALSSRGETYRALGQFEEALADLNRTIELDQNGGWKNYAIATVLFLQEDRAGASAQLEIAIDKFEHCDSPREISVRNLGNLIACRAAQEDFDEAHQAVTRFLDRHPNRYQIDEAIRDLSELSDIPGMDRAKIEELRTLLTQALPA